MKVISIDFGTKRIGVAIGDANLKIAVPLGTIPNCEGATERLAELIREKGCQVVVVGLPLTPSGREGQRAVLVKEFVKKLREKLPNVDIELWDERYSTQEAFRRLKAMGIKDVHKHKDEASALIILEEYLDNL